MITTDALLSILEVEENQALLQAALTNSLKENPLAFYKEIIQPRAPKLISAPSSLAEYATMTPSQEMKMMDSLTTGFTPTKETKVIQAVDFLERIFEESEAHEIDSAEIFKLAEKESINFNQVYSARTKLGIKCRQEGRRQDYKSFWYRPEEEKANVKDSNKTCR